MSTTTPPYAISTPYLRIPASQYFPIFKAGSEDIVLTVEFKNLNQNRVKFAAELIDESGKITGIPISAEISENKSYKRYNVLVKAGKSLVVSTTQPGFAVRAYKPALYAKPGMLHLNSGVTKSLVLHLDADGVHNVTIKGMPQGISISPVVAEIQQGMPVTFNVTRDAVSKVIGPIFFSVETLKIGTAIDILNEPPPIIDDGNSGGSGDKDPDIDPDMVSAYISGRDTVKL